MLITEFYLNKFLFHTEISKTGVYSLRIKKILVEKRDFIQIYSSGDKTYTTMLHFFNLIKELKDYFLGLNDTIKTNVDFNGYNEKEIKVYKSLMKVPFGNVTTYGLLAEYSLKNNANRYVGAVLSRNRLQIIVPCHRVVMKDLKIGGFTSELGLKLKILLLRNEGIIVKDSKLEVSKLYTFSDI